MTRFDLRLEDSSSRLGSRRKTSGEGTGLGHKSGEASPSRETAAVRKVDRSKITPGSNHGAEVRIPNGGSLDSRGASSGNMQTVRYRQVSIVLLPRLSALALALAFVASLPRRVWPLGVRGFWSFGGVGMQIPPPRLVTVLAELLLPLRVIVQVFHFLESSLSVLGCTPKLLKTPIDSQLI